MIQVIHRCMTEKKSLGQFMEVNLNSQRKSRGCIMSYKTDNE